MVHRRAPSNTIVVMVDGQEGPSTRTTKPRNLSSTRAHAIQYVRGPIHSFHGFWKG